MSFKYIIKAFSLAFGKDTPFESSWDNNVLYSRGSLDKTSAISSKTEISPDSLPKER